jgi:glycosyltransferase involved in cell wall biosynthesis
MAQQQFSASAAAAPTLASPASQAAQASEDSSEDLSKAPSEISLDASAELYGLEHNAGRPHRVLVLAYYFPPMGLSGVQRTLKFTKYMHRTGWEPTVITAGAVGYYALDGSLMDEAEQAGIRIERTSAFDVHSLLARGGAAADGKRQHKQIAMPREWIRKLASRVSNALFVPDNKRGWARQAYRKAKELLAAEPFDLIFVSAPPFSAARVGARLSREFGVPFVVDYRDLWYGNQFTSYPTPLHSYLHRKYEYNTLITAKKIIVTNRPMKQRIMAQYPFLTFDDIVIVPHGFDPADFQNAQNAQGANSFNTSDSKKMRIGYAGIFYDFVTPKYFFQAFAQILREQPAVAQDIELHFFGLLRKENVRLAKRLGLEPFVHNHGYLDHRDSVRGIVSCDVLWMMVGNARNADTISSGKLYEYFGSQKPIIACVPDGALAQAAEKYAASIITKPDNVQQIKLALLKMHQLYTEQRLPTPNPDIVQQHRRDYLTDQLTREFHAVVDNS